MRRLLVGVLVLVLALVPAALSAQAGAEHARMAGAPAGGIGEAERIGALAELWKEASYNFAYFDRVPELDWRARFVAYLPEVRAATGTFEFYRVLQRFMAELGDGHTLVFFPDSIVSRRPLDAPRVELEEIGRRAVVANVDTALVARVPVGSEVVRVDGEPVEERLRRDVFPYMAVSTEQVRWRDGIRGSARHMCGLLWGPAGSGVRLTLRTPGGDSVDVELARDRGSGCVAWVVPPVQRPLLEHRALPDGIAYVASNSFNDAALVAQFDSILPALSAARGVVLDVRRNRGGVDDVVRQIVARLSRDTLLGPAWRTRTHVAAYRAWGRFADEAEWAREYRPYWAGDGVWHVAAPDTVLPHDGARVEAPIALLIGSETASAAENFLIYMDRRTGTTRIGQPTNGSSGQPLMLDLPGGGRAWICTKRNTYPDGRGYIGTGVLPDIPIEPTVDDVRAGRDRALEAALEVLRRTAG